MLVGIITALHVIVCIILILVVLLQSGKGADLAGAFGGGATQTAFGSRGPTSFLSKLTTAAAVLFMGTCLALSMIGLRSEKRSVLDDTKGPAVPVSKAPAVQPQTPLPTPEQLKKMQEEIEMKQKQLPAESKKGATPAEATPSSSKPTPEKDTKPTEGPKKK